MAHLLFGESKEVFFDTVFLQMLFKYFELLTVVSEYVNFISKHFKNSMSEYTRKISQLDLQTASHKVKRREFFV